MAPLSNKNTKGYSIVELLVVLTIVGILAIVGVKMIGDRRGNSVRSVMDEVEGVLLAAQRNAMATGADVTISASGDWKAGTLVIDGRRTDPADATKRLGSASEVFTSGYLQSRPDHQAAGIDAGKGWYATALGSALALNKVDPGKTDPMLTALGTYLCTGAANSVTVSGTTKRFTTGFCIVVCGLRSGGVVAGGAVGVIVVPSNSTTVFKFYKREGETQWRRL